MTWFGLFVLPAATGNRTRRLFYDPQSCCTLCCGSGCSALPWSPASSGSCWPSEALPPPGLPATAGGASEPVETTQTHEQEAESIWFPFLKGPVAPRAQARVVTTVLPWRPRALRAAAAGLGQGNPRGASAANFIPGRQLPSLQGSKEAFAVRRVTASD